ncbi:hypothetical protein DFS34DRAFT_627565 [Phlyctochytrium arcticum]|nr:hypothetical protein DFS34DRAFT_627565 [Phlyctochytrium arcticum]
MGCKSERQQVLDAWSSAINTFTTFLICSRFWHGRAVYFSAEKRFSTCLQLLWTLLYLLRNQSNYGKVVFDYDPLQDGTFVNIFLVWGGYSAYLLILYKSTTIILTYFRTSRTVTFMDRLPDYIFLAATIGLYLSYANAAIKYYQYFDGNGSPFPLFNGLVEFNYVMLVLAILSLLAITTLVIMIMRAEKNNPFNNIILNKKMFVGFIGLQFSTMIYNTAFSVVQVQAGATWLFKDYLVSLLIVGTILIDMTICYFEYNHKFMFSSGTGTTKKGAPSSAGAQSPTAKGNSRPMDSQAG